MITALHPNGWVDFDVSKYDIIRIVLTVGTLSYVLTNNINLQPSS